jgi:hypothetical protein
MPVRRYLELVGLEPVAQCLPFIEKLSDAAVISFAASLAGTFGADILPFGVPFPHAVVMPYHRMVWRNPDECKNRTTLPDRPITASIRCVMMQFSFESIKRWSFSKNSQFRFQLQRNPLFPKTPHPPPPSRA